MEARRYHYTNSFKYKKSLQNIFSDVLNLHFIDYISIAELTPTTVTIYSSEPALEANLVESNLMQYDEIYTSKERDNELLIWDNYYKDKTNEIKQVKTMNYQLQFGFSLFETNTLLYSFATKSEMKDPVRFYSDRLSDMCAMGQYCYRQLKEKKLLDNVKTAKIIPFTYKKRNQHV